jgi:hypothetical protein
MVSQIQRQNSLPNLVSVNLAKGYTLKIITICLCVYSPSMDYIQTLSQLKGEFAQNAGPYTPNMKHRNILG